MKIIVVLIAVYANIFALTLSNYSIVSSKVAEVNRTQLKLILTGKTTRWEDGRKIELMVLSPSNYVQKEVILLFLGMSLSSYKELISRSKHIHVVRCKDLLTMVERTQNAIGITGKSKDSIILYIGNNTRIHIVEVKGF